MSTDLRSSVSRLSDRIPSVLKATSQRNYITDCKVGFAAFTIVFGVIIAVVSTSVCYLFQSFMLIMDQL